MIKKNQIKAGSFVLYREDYGHDRGWIVGRVVSVNKKSKKFQVESHLIAFQYEAEYIDLRTETISRTYNFNLKHPIHRFQIIPMLPSPEFLEMFGFRRS